MEKEKNRSHRISLSKINPADFYCCLAYTLPMAYPNQSRILKMIREMVSIDSRIGKELDLAVFLKEKLESMGLQTELVQLGKRANLYGIFKFSENGKTMMLNGHLDTVEPSEGMKQPFKTRVEKEWIYGLGVADMKGGIACILEAVDQLIELDLKGTLAVSFVFDEEGHGAGAKALIRNPQWKNVDAILIAEPFFDESIILGMTGKVLYNIEVHGKSAHAFRPHEGVNAITDAARIVTAIEDAMAGKMEFTFSLDPNFGSASFCTLKIEGGYKVYNVNVPDRCTIILNRLTLPNETKKSVVDDLKSMINSLNLMSTVKIDIIPPFYYPYKIERSHPLIQSLENAYQNTLNRLPKFSYEKMITDANIFMGMAKIPTAVFGPKGSDLHSMDERLHIPSLVPTVQILKDTVINFFDT